MNTLALPNVSPFPCAHDACVDVAPEMTGDVGRQAQDEASRVRAALSVPRDYGALRDRIAAQRSVLAQPEE